jgi:multidrug efflux pump subunit AcrA (membrane-fusion protein)
MESGMTVPYFGFLAKFTNIAPKNIIRAVVVIGLMVALVLWVALQWQASQATPSGMWVSAEAQPWERVISAEGPLSEASAISVVAPFDGTVVQRWVRPGDHVKAGDPLVRFDTSLVQAELRDAQAANIRAREDLAGVMSWQTSADVTGAQRQVVNTHRQMQAAQARLNDTQALFEKGIVARSEVENAQSEVSNATEQWQNAGDTLASVLRKGGAAQQQIARLEAESRSMKVRQLQERLMRATLTAPVAGVVLKPPQTEGVAPKDLADVGSFVSNRSVLMMIGDSNMYVVRAALDEFDAVRVKPGMPVEVTLNTDETALMQGELARVSGQGRAEQRFGANGAPMFDIEVLIGMTTRLHMVVDKQSAAMVVPLAAVRTDAAGRSMVTRRSAGETTGPGTDVIIETGATSADGILVVKGLEAGDSVWVPPNATPDTPPTRLHSPDATGTESLLPSGLGVQR